MKDLLIILGIGLVFCGGLFIGRLTIVTPQDHIKVTTPFYHFHPQDRSI